MVQQFESFQVSLLLSGKNMFLSKTFSMFEMEIHQNLRLNYYKKLQEWWTEDVDGECISFNLYRNTGSSIVLLKRCRGVFEKKELPNLSTMFLFRRVNSEWVVYQ